MNSGRKSVQELWLMEDFEPHASEEDWAANVATNSKNLSDRNQRCAPGARCLSLRSNFAVAHVELIA